MFGRRLFIGVTLVMGFALFGLTEKTAFAATVDLKVNDSNGPISDSALSPLKISWSSTGATSCTAYTESGEWTGTKATSGVEWIRGSTFSAKYTITCTGTSGSATDSVDLNPPTVDIKTSAGPGATNDGPVTIDRPQNVTILWSTTNGTSCTASGGWSGTKPIASGGVVIYVPSSTTYTITCTGPTGTASASDSITINVAPPAPTVDIKVTDTGGGSASNGPVGIVKNTPFRIQWTSQNTYTYSTACTASNGWTGTKGPNGTLDVSSITESKTYTITCSGPGGTASDSVTVNVVDVDLKVNGSDGPVSVVAGESAIISWTSNNTTGCNAQNWGSNGTKATSGSESSGAITSPKNYSILCSSAFPWIAGGTFSVTNAVSVNVTTPPAPTVDIKANSSNGPISIASGASATLSWTSADASSCTASNGWSGTKGTSGSESTGALTASKVYVLTCTGAGGTTADSVTVNVTAPPAPTVDIKANGSDGSISIASGTAATLSWTSTNASSCTASGSWTGSKAISGSQSTGALVIYRSYTLTCTSAGGTASDSVTVAIDSVGNNQPVAIPQLSINGGPASANVTVTKGVPVSITADASGSSDPDGWATATTGVAVGGTCEWNTDLNQGTPTFEKTISNPASPSACNTSIGNMTFNDNPGTYVYKLLRITDASGVVSKFGVVNITVTAAAPTVDIKANNTANSISIPYNTSATLSWSSTNATSCTASGGWTGTKATSGSESTGNLTASKTYTVTCTGAGNQTALSSVTVSVTPGITPTLLLKANNNVGTIQISYNTAATLTWPTTNASSCWASGDWSGWKTIGGSESTGNLTVSKTYKLQCWSVSGLETPISSVTVNIAPALTPTVDIKANGSNGPITIASGAAATISWSSTNATSCTASNGWSGSQTISGALSGNLTATKTYTLTCTGPGGTASDSVTVNVNGLGNDKPSAVAKFSINGGAANSNVTVTKGVPVSITADASGSSDPDGWTTATTGVSVGGKCEWNTDLNQGTPTFEKTITNPTSPSACNTSIGTMTFNDNPGTYTYNLLRITDAGGAVSNVGTVSVTVTDGNPANGAPVAVAKFRVNGGTPSSSITVTKGVPYRISLDASESYHPNGWGMVSNGGKCSWNTNLERGTTPNFRKIIPNPSSPSSCNVDLGTITFNDPANTYSYTLLQITDASGRKSLITKVDNKTNGLVRRLFPLITTVHAQSAESTLWVTVVD